MLNRNLLLCAFAIIFLVAACASSKSSGGIGEYIASGEESVSSEPVSSSGTKLPNEVILKNVKFGTPSNGNESPEKRSRESIMEVVNERLPELKKI